MIKVSLEVREGEVPVEVAVHAETISQAVGIVRERFPGRDVRVVFPIDGEEFFGGAEEDGARDGNQPELVPDRAG
ncbi:MAG: hypothetical protein AVDCRST_MAG03-3899 [uncultured Rubrobacteraceae bacterium]|uniref:MoaD/ThiS family protein n=1 Tax=uncultured Rubrobacteraceae bacterium TaxID=349277 RepID=A0A6J4QEU8_9ACTN|nr:MAG: hypothetical protein AVDCRST_MAG03-3899 [uncultured Rubrobacteraceae bacterium]